MKKYYMNLRYILPVLVLSFLSQITPVEAQTFSSVEYTENNEDIANPERGFYRHTETGTSNYSFLNETTLQGYRAEGFTLILRLFYLNGFVDSDISEEYLDNMQQDFNAMRAAGVKAVVRFAYTKRQYAPYGDATPARVVSHIKQLESVLKRNSDVIAVVQAGFVGAWGEWYYTDHFSENLGAPTAEDWANRRAVVYALLDALPENRAVQLRTPEIKFKITESTTPITEEQAFSGTAESRLGHHNDCFLASATDVGTYTSNMEAEKAYLEQETKYLPMGGETCGVSIPYSECPNALEQMERFHYSYLNSGYHPDVLSSWETDGCMPEVQKKLGYRFRLVESTLQESSKPGGEVHFSMKLLNEGWANPYNPRLVELMLREKSSGKIYKLPINEDPRVWPLADTIKISVTSGLPVDIEEGAYDMFLNLPDPEPTLYADPAYAIHLANAGLWDPETGYNSLQHTLMVDKSSAVNNYSGSDFFFSSPQLQSYTKVATDGQVSDWQPVPAVAVESGQAPEVLKVFNDKDSIYFLVTGTSLHQNYQLFIDADQSKVTGYNAWQWATNGADYLVENDIIYEYSGVNGAWGWVSLGGISLKQDDSVIEVGIPRSFFTGIALGEEISFGFVNDPAGEVASGYLPLQNQSFLSYRLLLNNPAKPLATSSGSSAIVYWGLDDQQVYRTIQRAAPGEEFTTIAILSPEEFYYKDGGLTVGVNYRYRYFASTANGKFVSTYTPVVEVNTTEKPENYVFSTDGNVEEWEAIAPVATARSGEVTYTIRFTVKNDSIYALLEGTNPESYEVYLDTDNDVTTGLKITTWQDAGYDYFVRNDSLYTDEDLFVQKVESAVSTGFYELAFPTSLLENLGQNTIVKTGAIFNLAFAEQVFVPRESKLPAVFIRPLPAQVPADVSVMRSHYFPDTQLIVQWGQCDCLGFVVERSVGNQDNFETVAEVNSSTLSYYDNDVVGGTTYYYRVYSFNENGRSDYSEVVFGSPEVVLGIENELFREIYLFPNPAKDIIQLNLAGHLPENLNIEWTDINGRGLSLYPVEDSEQGLRFNISNLQPGLYVLKISNNTGHRYIKMIKQ